MTLIESTYFSGYCDFSFGDQASIIHNLSDRYMSEANLNNLAFLEKYEECKSRKQKFMTLFIDNIRLYSRPLIPKNPVDSTWLTELTSKNDLLELCSLLPDMNFIIYTGHEDTPIDNQIIGKIPNNVIKIFAVNSVYYNDVITPLPYGLQRKLSTNDNRQEIIKLQIDNVVQPDKLLYTSHNIQTNINERSGIFELFSHKNWATVSTGNDNYINYLNNIKKHKFIICPIGNAIDCHRNWEVLYMRRVPVMKYHHYLVKLFDGLPVLFVNNYNEITEELLQQNENLYRNVIHNYYPQLYTEYYTYEKNN
jgi:hypothetical protein